MIVVEGDEIVLYGGGARPGGSHPIVIIHCVDDEILEWLARRERRRQRRKRHADAND